MTHCTLQPIVMLNKTIGSKVQGILENFNVIGSYSLSIKKKSISKKLLTLVWDAEFLGLDHPVHI